MLKSNPQVLCKISNTLRYIMVDEYQDTNYIEEQLIFLLAGERENICVVGDDDQGLYRFRGATIRNILEFPNKFAQNKCQRINLNINYRSNEAIIKFCDRWISNTKGADLFNWDCYRYEKQLISGLKNDYTPEGVYACNGETAEETQKELLLMIKRLKAQGNISDYNQIVFLFRSVKNEDVLKLGTWLEDNGIPIYSPRSELFFQRTEIKQLLGCFILCFQSYAADLKQNRFNHKMTEKLREYYVSCLKEIKPYLKSVPELKDYIQQINRTIEHLKDESEFGLLEIFYHLLGFEPLKNYVLTTPTDGALKNRAVRNLADFSHMIAKYNQIHNVHSISGKNKISLPEEFFNIYLKCLIEDGVGEYEDEAQYAPKGCISFMTFHQAKGLEFPVVVTGSLNAHPREKFDSLLFTAESRFFRREAFEPFGNIKYFDFWRQYYTAFSRAQNLLVLAKFKDSKNNYFDGYLAELPNIKEFNGSKALAKIKNKSFKHVYSFTSHIAVYEDCPRQYMYYKEYNFARTSMFHTSLGSLIHAVFEDMNKCIIEGAEEITKEMLFEWVSVNYHDMHKQTGYVLSDMQMRNVTEQITNYYNRRKDVLKQAWKAEEKVNLIMPGYILQGMVDLVEAHDEAVEIIDYKTGQKPDIKAHPERVEHYRKQLAIYAYLIKKKYGKKVRCMRLYYTNEAEDPWVTFAWKKENIESIIAEITKTVGDIENKNFAGTVNNSYSCRYCDMKYVCEKYQKE